MYVMHFYRIYYQVMTKETVFYDVLWLTKTKKNEVKINRERKKAIKYNIILKIIRASSPHLGCSHIF